MRLEVAAEHDGVSRGSFSDGTVLDVRAVRRRTIDGIRVGVLRRRREFRVESNAEVRTEANSDRRSAARLRRGSPRLTVAEQRAFDKDRTALAVDSGGSAEQQDEDGRGAHDGLQ